MQKTVSTPVMIGIVALVLLVLGVILFRTLGGGGAAAGGGADAAARANRYMSGGAPGAQSGGQPR